MDKSSEYSKLIQINQLFLQFVHCWDTNKHKDLSSPDCAYGSYRKDLIDAILNLDKAPESKTSKAVAKV